MENDLISVVIPIYNVEKYLNNCIDSVLDQSYTKLEVILVEDGSPDNCGNMCDEYSKKDDRIKVIHKENGGLSDARNAGIDIAIGKYIVFIDSDDFVENEYIEKLYHAIKSNNTKVSQCGIFKVNDNKEILEKIGYDNSIIMSGKDMLKDIYMFTHSPENTVIWNRMYDIDLFKNLRFPKGKIHEDEFTTYKILYDLDRVSIINDYLYNYRQTDQSITRTKFYIKKLDYIEAVEERIEFFKGRKDEFLYIKTLEKYMDKIIDYYVSLRSEVENSKKEQKELLYKFRKNYKKLDNKNFSKKRKLKYLMFKICPNILTEILKKRRSKTK